jgi:hypothetical protein
VRRIVCELGLGPETLYGCSRFIQITEHLVLEDFVVPCQRFLDLDGKALPDNRSGDLAFFFVNDQHLGERVLVGANEKDLFRLTHD